MIELNSRTEFEAVIVNNKASAEKIKNKKEIRRKLCRKFYEIVNHGKKHEWDD